MSTGTTSLAGHKARAWLWPALFSLVAFAANSVFCRLALKNGAIDPASFTVVRLASGAVFLLLLIRLRRPAQRMGGTWRAGLALCLYAFLFSAAYLQLSAGAGALLLFGAVQITMFGFAWCKGERISARGLLGMLIAFAGLLVLLLPGASAPPFSSALLMVISGIAWGAYTLLGRGSPRPLADTAGNFARSLPWLVVLAPLLLLGAGPHLSAGGLLFALGSGVLASGAGYAVWYGVVRQVSAQQAATLQLSVPVLAGLGGVALIGEPLSLRLLLASVVVLGGIALALVPRRQALQAKPRKSCAGP
ncbi:MULTISPECIES: DMT family transporter [Pseudomonas]|uniref:DMT family transporter n=1 Tax=Pseudomonas juntendi TaxID=2666183 RepID=A0A7W2LU34_9PSED|nr:MULTISPECIES: DMT family transporter [Pseudomonas]QOH69852.1 DMT family transporter [Pseudomonas putida]MBA6130510.1 DMT family transporter [Pseudomonas juntendi]MBA6147038.1 DMT family transporter [Pseudomonas juntendi]MCO7057397.1 DMT family transporter [Pseudomonas juntendi]MDH1548297.1 DMT family transporter [Pseudomonas juntendi]